MKRLILCIFFLLTVFAFAVPAFAQTSDVTVYATAQRFERGLMLWRSDTSYIWVLANSGQVYNFPSSRYSQLPDNPIRGNFPSPINGFGRVWGNFSAVRTAIGLPTLSELGFDMRIVQQGGVYYLQQLDGTIYQVNPNGTWSYAPGMPVNLPPATIGGFDVQPLSINPGGSVMVTWSLLGVSRARLEVWDVLNNSLVQTLPALPSSGATQVAIPPSITGRAGIILTRDDDFMGLPRAEIVVTVQSSSDHSVIVSAAYQPYQNGFMFWRSDTGAVYAFANAGYFYAYSMDFLQSLPDNALGAAPPNFVRPINGFGRVWGNVAQVRNTLGWATAPEQAYTATIILSQGAPTSFTLPNNHSVTLNPGGGWRLS